MSAMENFVGKEVCCIFSFSPRNPQKSYFLVYISSYFVQRIYNIQFTSQINVYLNVGYSIYSIRKKLNALQSREEIVEMPHFYVDWSKLSISSYCHLTIQSPNHSHFEGLGSCAASPRCDDGSNTARSKMLRKRLHSFAEHP